jgi:hypothetical protein
MVSRDAVARELATGELTEVKVPGTPLLRPWHAATHIRTSASTSLLLEYLLDSEHTTGWRRPPPGGFPRRSTRRGVGADGLRS